MSSALLTLSSGKFVRYFRLSGGSVKCIVGDGVFIYAGCNDGSLFDLTSNTPRLMCKIEAFGPVRAKLCIIGCDISAYAIFSRCQIFSVDIKHGMLAAADGKGQIVLVNCEGALYLRIPRRRDAKSARCRRDCVAQAGCQRPERVAVQNGRHWHLPRPQHGRGEV